MRGASHRTSIRSSVMVSSVPGRCTFTATSSPVTRRPRYTCPRDAAAMGAGESSLKTLETPPLPARPSSSSMRALASSVGKGGSASCSCRSASMYAGERRSPRMEMACPILMKVGPRKVNRSVSSSARRFSFFASIPPCLSMYREIAKPAERASMVERRLATLRGRLLKYRSAAGGSYTVESPFLLSSPRVRVKASSTAAAATQAPAEWARSPPAAAVRVAARLAAMSSRGISPTACRPSRTLLASAATASAVMPSLNACRPAPMPPIPSRSAPLRVAR
mmetsp:Transcript_35890/g.113511  ORF Transcript_35890/g.113511 Transcript_35890/m.113511 type:complete len:279 (+) Transcript_35890:1016-1852(+)